MSCPSYLLAYYPVLSVESDSILFYKYDCDRHQYTLLLIMDDHTLTTCTALQESKFWKFMLKDVQSKTWMYVVWILLRKCIFAGIMTLTIGSANALANVVLHFADLSAILLIR
jgi:hypothetical protein